MFCRFHSFTARYHSHCPAGCRQRFEELRTLGPQDLIHRIHRIVSSLNVMLPERNVHGLYRPGKHTKSYLTWLFIVDLPIKSCDFPELCGYIMNYIWGYTWIYTEIHQQIGRNGSLMGIYWDCFTNILTWVFSWFLGLVKWGG
jgi:hypothetical protein